MQNIRSCYNAIMKENTKGNEHKNLIDAYKRVRKPVAPPERVIPDKRGKLRKRMDANDAEDYEARAHVFISGMVQGVYFRALTVEAARSASLSGWVRNLKDGRVEIVMEGDKEDVQHVIDWCHVGPPPARVDNVEIFWEEPTGEFKGFEARHTF